MSEIKKRKFLKLFKEIKGKKCYYSYFNAEKILSLYFGKEVVYLPLRINLENNKFFSIGEFTICIACLWRIEQNNKILFTNECLEDDKAFSIIAENVNVLLNKKVLQVNINKDTYDFYIDFEDNYRLTVINNFNQFTAFHKFIYSFNNFNDYFKVKTNDTLIYEELKGQMFLEDYLKTSVDLPS